MGYRDIPLLVLLFFECPRYPFGVGEVRIAVGHFFMADEEANVADAGE